MSRRLPGALRGGITVVMLGMATSCGTPPPGLTESVRSALGAPDGYVFVVSPFNCDLSGRQIDLLNAIGARRRRSGVILASGAAVTDSVAAAAVAALGIRMSTGRFTGTAIERDLTRLGWQPPLVLAVRRGEVVGVLRGSEVRRLDTWIGWLERTSPLTSTGAVQ